MLEIAFSLARTCLCVGIVVALTVRTEIINDLCTCMTQAL